MSIKILLADDHRLVRQGLRALLEREPDMEVVGEASDGAEAVALAKELLPDVVVMDIAMPVMSGIEATRQICASLANTRVVVLSMHGHRAIVMEVLRAGATGYLLKDCAREGLAHAIRTVDANLTFLTPGLADTVLEDYVRQRSDEGNGEPVSLTKRERQVLKNIADGLSTREIADQLGVSVKTIETYRRQLMAKLDAPSVAALTKHAIRIGLTTLNP